MTEDTDALAELVKRRELEARQAIADHAVRLLEGWDIEDAWIPAGAPFHADPLKDTHRSVFRQTMLRDRADGRFLPVYDNEHTLARIRQDARILNAFDSVAVGALESLLNYEVGTGCTIEVTGSDKKVVEIVDKLVQRIADDNEFSGVMDRELAKRSREDGEALVFVDQDEGSVIFDVLEPDELTEPLNAQAIVDHFAEVHQLPDVPLSFSFGVLTPETRSWQAFGYHVVRNEAGTDWEFLPATRIEHIKRNVPRKAKRGLSDFLPVNNDFLAESKLRRNVAEGAAIQAAIAFIREHVEGKNKSEIEAYVSSIATHDYDKSIEGGTRRTQIERLQPGTIKDIPAGMKYHAGPMGSLNHPVFVEVAQYIMRVAGVRWNMPEYLVSGDASNSNFASTLVAESPFVKARQAGQAFLARHFERLLWKGLLLAWELRLLPVAWEQVRAAVEITVKFDDPASRDAGAMASANAILFQHKIKSRATWQAEAGLDPEEEDREIANDPLAFAAAEPGAMTTGEPLGEFGSTSRLQWKRNIKAIRDVLDGVISGDMTPTLALEMLKSLGLPPTRAQTLIDDAQDNAQIDDPEIRESLDDQSRLVIEALWRRYP